jgi:hypothetical protein
MNNSPEQVASPSVEEDSEPQESKRVNRQAYQQMIDGNIAWLEKMPRTLERDHVLAILRKAVEYEYGPASSSGHPAGEGAPTDVDDPSIEYLLDYANDFPRSGIKKFADALRSAHDKIETVLRMKGVVEGHVASLESELAAALSRVEDLERERVPSIAELAAHTAGYATGQQHERERFLKLREEVDRASGELSGHTVKAYVLSLLDRATTKDTNA